MSAIESIHETSMAELRANQGPTLQGMIERIKRADQGPLEDLSDLVTDAVFDLNETELLALFAENPALMGVHCDDFLEIVEQADAQETWNTTDLMGRTLITAVVMLILGDDLENDNQ